MRHGFFGTITTLVVMATDAYPSLVMWVPTRDGIVVCADKRQTTRTVVIDSAEKVLIVRNNSLIWFEGTIGLVDPQTGVHLWNALTESQTFFSKTAPTAIVELIDKYHRFIVDSLATALVSPHYNPAQTEFVAIICYRDVAGSFVISGAQVKENEPRKAQLQQFSVEPTLFQVARFYPFGADGLFTELTHGNNMQFDDLRKNDSLMRLVKGTEGKD